MAGGVHQPTPIYMGRSKKGGKGEGSGVEKILPIVYGGYWLSSSPGASGFTVRDLFSIRKVDRYDAWSGGMGGLILSGTAKFIASGNVPAGTDNPIALRPYSYSDFLLNSDIYPGQIIYYDMPGLPQDLDIQTIDGQKLDEKMPLLLPAPPEYSYALFQKALADNTSITIGNGGIAFMSTTYLALPTYYKYYNGGTHYADGAFLRGNPGNYDIEIEVDFTISNTIFGSTIAQTLKPTVTRIIKGVSP